MKIISGKRQSGKTTTPGKIANAIKWIDALKSGEYKRGKSRLGNKEDGYCCLGVGCLITSTKFNNSDESSSTFQKVVGLTDECGRINSKGVLLPTPNYFPYTAFFLTELNDQTELTFPQIADIIVNHTDTLFEPDVAKGVAAHYGEQK